jgi:hypothetical protein
VCRVSLGLGGSDREGCVGVGRIDMISSGGKVLIRCPWGEYMGLGGVSFSGGGGMGGNCVKVWKG